MRRPSIRLLLALGLLSRSALAVPSTTIVISEFRTTGPTGGSDEFVEIYNLTSAPIDVSGFKINGSNGNGSTGTRVTFNPGTILPPKGFLLVTNKTGYSGTVPGDQTYDTGITDDGGVAILDKTNKVIDAVGMSSGSAYKEGTVLAQLTSGKNASYRRKSASCTPTQDTDNNKNDFDLVNPSTPQNKNTCCSDAQCSQPPTGQCYPANGTCDTGTGACSYAIQPGKSCDDGNACTDSDVCLPGGACQGSNKSCNTPPAPVCIDANTQRSYNASGSCSAGTCSYSFVDSACSCNQATGLCQDPCAGVVCNSPPNAQCYEGAGACNPATGSCVYNKKATGTACNDGAACTTADKCDAAGLCTGTPTVCTPPGPTCVGNSSRTFSGGSCDSGNGSCSFSQSDTSCTFGCDGVSGLCKPNPCAGVSCTTPPGSCFQSVGVCDPGNGQCVYSPKPGGTACDDGAPCTESDVCNGAGTCAGSSKVCTPPGPACVGNSSRTFSGGSCDAANGSCSFSQSDTPCASGCDAATGLCKNDPCANVVCDKPPSQCHLSLGSCSGGTCTYALKPQDASCNDGNDCTTTDRCNAAGQCVGSTLVCNTPPAPTCSGKNSISSVPVGTCQAGTCSYSQVTTECAFGCDSSTGLCVGDPCSDVTCTTPPSPCHAPIGSCTAGSCSYGLKQAGAACDDGDPCTVADACGAAGVCKGSPDPCNTPPAPSCADGVSTSFLPKGTCKAGVCEYTKQETPCALGCDASTSLCSADACVNVVCDQPPSACHVAQGKCALGECSYDLKPAGAACDDSNACTDKDACDDQGKCSGVTKVCNSPPKPECLDGKTSQAPSALGTCSPSDGSCGYDLIDTPCAFSCDLDSGLCVSDPCVGITCKNPPSPCHAPLGKCSDGDCSYDLKPAGAACDDGDECTTVDSCDAQGECKGKPSAACAGAGGSAGSAGSSAGSAGKGGASGAAGKGGAGAAGTAGQPSAGAGGAGAGGSGGSGGAGAGGVAGAPAAEAPSANAPGCGCAVPGQPSGAPAGAVAALALLVGLRRRRASGARASLVRRGWSACPAVVFLAWCWRGPSRFERFLRFFR